MLYVYPDAGLGNRLNCIYSGLYWQRRLGMKMKILWEVDIACCIRFEGLFSPLPNVKIKTVYTLPLRKKRKIFYSLVGKLVLRLIKKTPEYLSAEEMQSLYAHGGEAAIERLLLEPKTYCMKASSVFADWEHISEVVSSLEPAEKIRKRVDAIMNPYEGHPVIGIHVRRTDHTLAIENSPLSLFIGQMKSILEEKPDTCFYLATDDENVEQQLSKRFPLIAHQNFSDKKTRWTERGMMDAYVDLLCLSRCDRIYGSFGSTFSNMAAVIGGKECIVLKK